MLCTILAWTMFPLVAGGTIVVAARAIEAGFAPLVVAAGVVIVVASLTMLVEHRFPFRADWRRTHGDRGTDILHFVISGGLAQLAQLAIVLGAVTAASALAARVPIDVWPTAWPLSLQLGLALLLFELGGYWLHRLQHERGWLWRVHAVHHSAPRLYWLTGARNHPLDLAITFAVSAVPVILLGASELILTLLGMLLLVHALLQHANLRLELGPFVRVINIVTVHRGHHSTDLDVANANYGNLLLIWDWVFGTYHPHTTAELEVGLAAPAGFPTHFLGQLRSPFSRALWRPETIAPRAALRAHGDGPRDPPATGGDRAA